jgi:hypothetical protein
MFIPAPTLRSRRHSVLLIICETVIVPTQTKEMSAKFSGQNRQWAPLSRIAADSPNFLGNSVIRRLITIHQAKIICPVTRRLWSSTRHRNTQPVKERDSAQIENIGRATKAHGSSCPRMVPQCPNI